MTTCTVLTQRLHNLHQEDPANLAEMAAHIRACARCRRGQIALPPGFGLPVYLTLDHGARQPTLALYYEATHPEYPLAQLGDREVVATAYTWPFAPCAATSSRRSARRQKWRSKEIRRCRKSERSEIGKTHM